jgi:antitoxin component YwqK of YwqJK toxin-antitoxin module
MKIKLFALLGLLVLSLSGCNNCCNQDDNVVSERYIHKYGYAVSKQDWEEKNYPGQAITNLSNGVTVTTTYENGIKHGPTTHTFPHSQTVEHYCLYNQGNRVKEIAYDPTGIPVEEWVQLSPTRYSITTWYAQGSPMAVEEFVGDELLDGQYFTLVNELESHVEKGIGQATRRDRNGLLLATELFEEGYAIKKETFYANGAPKSIAYYYHNNLHGEKHTFAQCGEPLAIEEWVNGQLHGKSTYFKNGNRYLEIAYLYGQKNGIERHYIDADMISQEIVWENDLKHGPSVFYADGKPEHHWFYAGESVSKRKYDELTDPELLISHIPYRDTDSFTR